MPEIVFRVYYTTIRRLMHPIWITMSRSRTGRDKSHKGSTFMVHLLCKSQFAEMPAVRRIWRLAECFTMRLKVSAKQNGQSYTTIAEYDLFCVLSTATAKSLFPFRISHHGTAEVWAGCSQNEYKR